MNKRDLTYAIKMKGLELGFAKVGMGNSGDKRYIQMLKKVLNNKNKQVCDAAQWAIEKLEKLN